MSDPNNRRSIIATEDGSPKRIVSAPTLYCIFALGIILVIVGTFISAHAYFHHQTDEDDQRDESDNSDAIHSNTEHKVLRILGPILLGAGGLLLLGMSIICLIVYKKNKGFPRNDSECFTVGASTFYNNHQQNLAFSSQDDGFESANSHINNRSVLGFENVSGVNGVSEDPITFLANVVVQERRRKLSHQKLPNTPEIRITRQSPALKREMRTDKAMEDFRHSSKDTIYDDNGKSLQHLGLQELRRIPNTENLPQEGNEYDDYSQFDESVQPISRQRFHSMLGPRRPKINSKIDKDSGLRRFVSLTNAARNEHRQELRRRQNLRLKINQSPIPNYPPELSPSLSLKRKKKKDSKKGSNILVHELPSYSPDVIDNLIQLADNKDLKEQSSTDLSSIHDTPRKDKRHRSSKGNEYTDAIIGQTEFYQQNKLADESSSDSSDVPQSYSYRKHAGKSRSKGNKKVSSKGKRIQYIGDNILRNPTRTEMTSDPSEVGDGENSDKRNSASVSDLKKQFEDSPNITRTHFSTQSRKTSFPTHEQSTTNSEQNVQQKRRIKEEELNTATTTSVEDFHKYQNYARVDNRLTNTCNNPYQSQAPQNSSSSAKSSCSSCSGSPQPPPTPEVARSAAVDIMMNLQENSPAMQRRKKTLSIISSHDENWDSDSMNGCPATYRYSCEGKAPDGNSRT